MKAYFFSHSYLSSIQKGLQATHCLAEMVENEQAYSYLDNNNYYKEWADTHKTIVILNGGDSQNLWIIWETICSILIELQVSYPVAFFEEDQSLNGAITCVGIIVPMDAPIQLLDYIAQFQLAV